MAFKGELDSVKIVTVLDDYAGYETSFLAQHGIALLLEACSNGVCKRILMDAGQSALPILHNMKLMDIDPASIDAVIISHCHYDHTEGLADTLRAIGRKNIPVIAHPGMFRPNYIFNPFIRNIGVMKENGPEAIEAAGGVMVMVDEPFEIMPGVISTGVVPRKRDFEQQGIGTYNIEDGKVVPDQIIDDLSLAVKVKGKGLAVISGCSHAGIVNIIDWSRELAAEPRVDVVIGGFHLIEASQERIEKTAQALKQLNVGRVITGHCTGLAALCEFRKVLGDRFEHLHVGTTVQL
ncbi:MAG TPA: MBL fold metallo-hydrolase [Synergistales bacterium]|nr:MBL fold metallo-hydrolase [Synergistales bacterium]